MLQDRIDYLFDVNRQLEDSNYYRPLQESMRPETWEIIWSVVQKLYDKGYINCKQLTYLYGPNDPQPHLFYLLSKIHKPP